MAKLTRVRLKERLLTAAEVATRLHITTLTVYRWQRSGGLPARVLRITNAPAQKFSFSEKAVTDWLRENRPELLPTWNGEDAPVRRITAWTRRRLREAVLTAMAA